MTAGEGGADVQPQPLVIAHRGASGYLPEHTLAAKALAFGQGADYLEQDVVATRDGELIVCHDLYLDAVTDVRQRFPGRARDDGLHYCIDFDLAELRTLNVIDRVRPDTRAAWFPGRFGTAPVGFRLHTLAEELDFIAALNRGTGRAVGVYPEIKDPAWHRQHGVEAGDRLLAVLEQHWQRTGGVFVQCFDPGEVVRLARRGCPWPLVQLVEAGGGPAIDGLLESCAGHAAAVGVDLRLLAADGGAAGAPLMATARRLDLAVHAWTARSDALPTGYRSLDQLLSVLCGTLAVDGIFTDFPDRLVAFRTARELG